MKEILNSRSEITHYINNNLIYIYEIIISKVTIFIDYKIKHDIISIYVINKQMIFINKIFNMRLCRIETVYKYILDPRIGFIQVKIFMNLN